MNNLTLLIPANKESESLPLFLDELNDYSYKKMIVLQEEDVETINSISNFKDVEIFKQIKEIDGFLIGGASKSSKKFIDIIKNYYR